MLTAFILIFLLYSALICVLIIGWYRAVRMSPGTKASTIDLPRVSIIIAARNEAERISPLIEDLKNQQYNLFEVIIVDDHSEDGTSSTVSDAFGSDPRFTLISATNPGKKSSLTEGIAAATGSIILTTDADCRVNPLWLESMVRFFDNEATMMVFGGVSMQSDSFFDAVQAMEFSSLIGSGAATAGLQVPSMCNGANLAFRKSVFEQIGGYLGNLTIPSGDDEFIMRKIKLKYPGSVRFAAKPETVVWTSTNRDLRQLLHQRLRWAGKWHLHRDTVSRLLAVFIFSFQFSALLLPAFVVAGTVAPIMAAMLWIAKMSVEFIFLRRVNLFLGQPWSWRAFLLLQLVYPAYTVFIAIACNFRTFEWKGRKLKPLTVSAN